MPEEEKPKEETPKEAVKEEPKKGNKEATKERLVEKKDDFQNLTAAKNKFAEGYKAGVCEALFKAGKIKDIKSCIKASEPEAEKLAEKWEAGWTKGIKKFLGLPE